MNIAVCAKNIAHCRPVQQSCIKQHFHMTREQVIINAVNPHLLGEEIIP